MDFNFGDIIEVFRKKYGNIDICRRRKKYVNCKTDEELTLNNLEEEIKKLKKEKKVNNLLLEIQKLSDEKTLEAKKYISKNKNFTQEQEDRYLRKYQQALDCINNDNCNKLQAQANLLGVDVKDLVDLIIQKHDEWYEALDNYIDLIEAYRIKAQDIIKTLQTEDELNLAKEYLEKAQNFGVDTTEQDLIDFFSEFKNMLNELRDNK